MPFFGGGGGTVVMETPSGDIDGINVAFVFTSPPLQVFYQGQLQNGGDYALVGSTVTFTIPPVSGSVLGLVAG